MVINVIAFIIGVIFALYYLLPFIEYFFKTRNKNSNIYRYWQGDEYEVLFEDALDEDNNLKHKVVFRALFGRRNTFVMDKDKFFGKVKDFKGNEVDRFTKIN